MTTLDSDYESDDSMHTCLTSLSEPTINRLSDFVEPKAAKRKGRGRGRPAARTSIQKVEKAACNHEYNYNWDFPPLVSEDCVRPKMKSTPSIQPCHAEKANPVDSPPFSPKVEALLKGLQLSEKRQNKEKKKRIERSTNTGTPQSSKDRVRPKTKSTPSIHPSPAEIANPVDIPQVSPKVEALLKRLELQEKRRKREKEIVEHRKKSGLSPDACIKQFDKALDLLKQDEDAQIAKESYILKPPHFYVKECERNIAVGNKSPPITIEEKLLAAARALPNETKMDAINAHLPPGFVMPDLSKPPPSLHSRRIVGSSTPQLPPKNFAPPPPTVAPPHVAPPPPSISQVPKVTTTPRIKFGPAPPPPTPRQPKLVPEGKPIPSYEWSGGPAEYYEDLYGDEKICTSPGPECYMEYYTDGPGQSNDNEKDQEVKTSDKLNAALLRPADDFLPLEGQFEDAEHMEGIEGDDEDEDEPWHDLAGWPWYER